LDVGAPIPTINAAVEARIISAYKDERVAASRVLAGPEPAFQEANPERFIGQVEDALYVAKICSYAQGFALLRAASAEYGYNLTYGEIAKIWRGGCIIRAALLEDIRTAFAAAPELPNLLMDRTFGAAVMAGQGALREGVAFGVRNGIPVPALASAVAYFDAYRSERLPANLTQAQRDYFGAHTYRRVDREGTFHTVWQDFEVLPD